MYTETLASSYQKILTDVDTSLLDPHNPNNGNLKNLSGLFLTSVPQNYKTAKTKIMIIGRETRGWNVLNKAKGERFTSISEYIEKSMAKHQKFFENQLNKSNSRGCTFHNFTRSVAKKCGKDGIIYSNLFCFDWKQGSPMGCPYFEKILKYSELLLKTQIEHLKPDIIIFANGMKSVPYRRQFFPISGECKVCRNGLDFTNEGLQNNQLWQFQLNENILCFRIQHPSARSENAAKTRKFLIDLLPSAESTLSTIS